jgi:hypothetical protein
LLAEIVKITLQIHGNELSTRTDVSFGDMRVDITDEVKDWLHGSEVNLAFFPKFNESFKDGSHLMACGVLILG